MRSSRPHATKLALVILASCLARWPSAVQAQLPAFPGAAGFGAFATGGHGGEIYHVTNLNDRGPGSFRDAVSKGHRVVVFNVGGYIELKRAVSVASDITILGQSPATASRPKTTRFPFQNPATSSCVTSASARASPQSRRRSTPSA